MSQAPEQASSDATSGLPSRPRVSTTGGEAGSWSPSVPSPSPSSSMPPPTPRRRYSVSGPAQIMAQKVLDMNCEVPDRSLLATCDNGDLIQALMNSSNHYQSHAAWIEAKDGDTRSAKMKQAAEKWSFINAADSDLMITLPDHRLITLLTGCLTDVRCIKSNRIDLIHRTIVDFF